MRMRPEKEDTTKKSGYTMLEIMVVVGILMVIVTMAIPSVNRSKRHAYESAAIEGLRALYEAEELYYDELGYYTAGQDHINDLRRVDAIDPKAYTWRASQGNFIKGYSIFFTDIGEFPQNYSCMVLPLIRGMDLRTFYMESDGIVRDLFGNPL